jgi:hypothetical protein
MPALGAAAGEPLVFTGKVASVEFLDVKRLDYLPQTRAPAVLESRWSFGGYGDVGTLESTGGGASG